MPEPAYPGLPSLEELLNSSPEPDEDKELEALLAEGDRSRAVASDSAQLLTLLPEEGNPRPFRLWYEAIIDWMLLNPGRTQQECAAALGRAPNTISMIVNSSAFRARYAQRRAEHNARLSDAIADKASELALAALSEMQKRVKDNPAAIPTSLLLKTTDTALERLGYGVRPVTVNTQPATVSHTNVQINTVSRETLAHARNAMRAVQDTLAEKRLDAAPVITEVPHD